MHEIVSFYRNSNSKPLLPFCCLPFPPSQKGCLLADFSTGASCAGCSATHAQLRRSFFFLSAAMSVVVKAAICWVFFISPRYISCINARLLPLLCFAIRIYGRERECERGGKTKPKKPKNLFHLTRLSMKLCCCCLAKGTAIVENKIFFFLHSRLRLLL